MSQLCSYKISTYIASKISRMFQKIVIIVSTNRAPSWQKNKKLLLINRLNATPLEIPEYPECPGVPSLEAYYRY